MAKGGIGDAFAQLGQPEDALGFYDKAVAHSENGYTTPKFLYKAGITALDTKQYDKALSYFERIKEDYTSSEQARNIDAFIGMAEGGE